LRSALTKKAFASADTQSRARMRLGEISNIERALPPLF
jgi:hypothetical protein